jgi:Protein of unknown function (DUF4230)
MKRFVPFLLVMAAMIVVIGAIVMNEIRSISLGDTIRIITTPTTTFNSGPIILDAIKNQARLETVAMVFANDQDVSKEWGLEVVGEVVCRENITYLGYYTVTAGVDLQKIAPTDIYVVDRETPAQSVITITLPAAVILHIEPDTQRSRVVHKDVSIISQFCGTKLPEMVLEAQLKIEEYAKGAALEKGILQMAQERASFELQQLLIKIGYPDVYFKYSE